jgi:ABC-type Zn uptake system ZnuABC Zn-binding protein ZnuA
MVAATMPDLGSLVGAIGGEQVSVAVFTKGGEDPHFTPAKPSFAKILSQADLYVQNGLELEVGWAPVLLRNSRNARVLPGSSGYLDASAGIAPLGVVATGQFTRLMGDVHVGGNPHYLSDPINGLIVARHIRDALVVLRPEQGPYFMERFEEFRRQVSTKLAGREIASKYEIEKLAKLQEHGKLLEFLKGRGEVDLLAGWWGATLPHRGTKVIADHDLWPYFARRFGITVTGFLEPKPGLEPTTRHLQELVGRMKADGVRIVLSTPYFDPRFARFVADKTGARIVELAHQVGARPEARDYLATVDYNVGTLVAAFGNPHS